MGQPGEPGRGQSCGHRGDTEASRSSAPPWERAGLAGPRAGGVCLRAESRLSWGDEGAPARSRIPGGVLMGEGAERGKPCRRESALVPKMHLPPRDGGRPRNEVGRQAEQLSRQRVRRTFRRGLGPDADTSA
ncbi:unnamed protein product [Rangifer tarandus platyrhynchus]|uniref:Uncharacterized protein n=2 Tax=Rangifer tarandus platyrhynchus TaxID=3082113 RepID=A0ACB0FHU0_RANTA|nr:unnamed protein product [Rangifer tarandus platyrhynchus]CAI9712658.1 unnamed protein product [Rangifer tarandus platyrhynchus]